MPRFIKAQQGLYHTVIYTDDTGKLFRFSGGTWAWRNHNPGNLRPGSISYRNHQIGFVIFRKKKFAIFPDFNTGQTALIDLLRTIYLDKSLAFTISKFAPPNENDTAAYIEKLRKKTGIRDDRKIKEFTPDQFQGLWEGIEHIEGYKIGTITEIYQITKVRADKKGIIESYYVDTLGWISKERCITLAKQGKLNVVVCNSSLGNKYVRSKPDKSVKDNLDHLIKKDT